MSTPVNMGAIHAMGAQFNQNVFAGINKKASKAGKTLQAQAAKNVPTAVVSGSKTTNFRTTAAGPKPPRQTVGALPSGTSNTPKAVGTGFTGAPALPPGQMITTPYHQGASPHSMTPSTPALPPGKYRGIATPYQGGNRVIPMSGNAALTNRVNPNASFSGRAETDNPINRTAFNQPAANPFHAPAQSNVSNSTQFKAAPKPSATPFSVGPITPAPRTSSASAAPMANKSSVNPPAQQSQQQLSSQFANVSTKSNAPYPTHEHPSGSSNMILQNASKALSEPGRPNTLTVGSRNASPGGIAAAGSRLEAWASAKSSAVQARQASKRAGGRDKDLAQQANAAENLANQPLSRFAP